MVFHPRHPTNDSLSSAYGLESHLEVSRRWNREVKLLEAYDPPISVLHKDHLVPGLLAYVLVLGIAKPYGKSIACSIVEYLHLLHVRSPSLIDSVGKVVMRK